ncbi:hypothetical protein QBC45DRAFT_165703 [Copromyces sp. CBS 386.78]|nr:hypothetical protein QBC45DRAFT_165703 [Copromyces sp. CBS 386.78]
MLPRAAGSLGQSHGPRPQGSKLASSQPLPLGGSNQISHWSALKVFSSSHLPYQVAKYGFPERNVASLQANLCSVISTGDQQSCQQPRSCTKRATVSAPEAKQRGDSTSKPASTSKRPVNFSFFEFSLFFSFFSPTQLRETFFLRDCLHSLITKHGTPKAKGAYPRLYAKQRPGPPGATRSAFSLSTFVVVLPTSYPVAHSVLCRTAASIAGSPSAHPVRKFSHASDRFAHQPRAALCVT